MGKVTGFLEIERLERKYKPASDRIRHFNEFVIPLSEEGTKIQATSDGMTIGVAWSA